MLAASWAFSRKMAGKNLAGPAIALAVIFLTFTFLVPDWSEQRSFYDQITQFANLENISNILRQTSMSAVAALGMTFIIIAGGIDLSAGSLAALTGVIIAVVLRSGTPADWHMNANPILWPL